LRHFWRWPASDATFTTEHLADVLLRAVPDALAIPPQLRVVPEIVATLAWPCQSPICTVG